MKVQFKIPSGWRRLKNNELLRKNDRWMDMDMNYEPNWYTIKLYMVGECIRDRLYIRRICKKKIRRKVTNKKVTKQDLYLALLNYGYNQNNESNLTHTYNYNWRSFTFLPGGWVELYSRERDGDSMISKMRYSEAIYHVAF